MLAVFVLVATNGFFVAAEFGPVKIRPLAHFIEPLFAFAGGTAATELAHSAATAISFFLITLFHIVLGELVPKSIALQHSEGTASFAAFVACSFPLTFRFKGSPVTLGISPIPADIRLYYAPLHGAPHVPNSQYSQHRPMATRCLWCYNQNRGRFRPFLNPDKEHRVCCSRNVIAS